MSLHQIISIDDIRSPIRKNFSRDVGEEFDVGYIQGTTIIRVRSKDDIDEMWSEIQKSKNTSLWCDGFVDNRTGNKRKFFSDGKESDEEQVEVQN